MYKTELINMVHKAYNDYQVNNRERQLYSCTAWYTNFFTDDNNRFYILRSYNTLVAVYSCQTETVYVFDHYSSTTSKHISKFAKLMRAEKKVNLYADSRTSKKTKMVHEWTDYTTLIMED